MTNVDSRPRPSRMVYYS